MWSNVTIDVVKHYKPIDVAVKYDISIDVVKQCVLEVSDVMLEVTHVMLYVYVVML